MQTRSCLAALVSVVSAPDVSGWLVVDFLRGAVRDSRVFVCVSRDMSPTGMVFIV